MELRVVTSSIILEVNKDTVVLEILRTGEKLEMTRGEFDVLKMMLGRD